MRITGLEYRRVDMRLTEPYVIAYETIESATNVFLRVLTDRGIVGYGCAGPDVSVTGETPESVLQACGDVLEPVLRGADPLRRALLRAELGPQLAAQPSVMAMVDMALLDILGKVSGLPLYSLLGGFRERIVTSVTISILPLEQTVAKAKELTGNGIRSLKLKGGLDAADDVERVRKVREAVGPEPELRFDANQGYTVEETREFAQATHAANVTVIEQPTPRDKPELLVEASNRTDVPIMADESVMNAQDLLDLVHAGFTGMINVKLMKVGGIAEALRISMLAQTAGLGVMVGCMDEAALGIAAGLHLALASPSITHADLDAHLDLLEDPSAGAVLLKDGALYPTNKPGLGAELGA